MKLKKWDEAIKDCKRALELDSSAVKGHYFLGEAYMEQNMFDESIKNLTKGKDWNWEPVDSDKYPNCRHIHEPVI